MSLLTEEFWLKIESLAGNRLTPLEILAFEGLDGERKRRFQVEDGRL